MTKVAKDQFEWDGDKLTHKPTGARFNRNSAVVNRGRCGDDLENGECYGWDEVLSEAHQMILRSHVKK